MMRLGKGAIRSSLLKDIERFSRLFLVRDIGISGIKKLRETKAAVVGCGATGTHIAELLVRAGVGHVTVIDKDFVDISNIYRTSLFTEEDARNAVPKAVACARELKRIDSSVKVVSHVTKLTPANAEELLSGHDIILDGTDNFTARLIINDFAVKHGVPWVLAGVGTWYGNVWLIDPAKGTPCMRCLFTRVNEEDRPNACDVLGVVPTAVSLVASIAASLALMRVLGMSDDKMASTFYVVDAKRISVDAFRVVKRRDCPACVRREFEYLNKNYVEQVAKPICGTRAVEIMPPKRMELRFDQIIERVGKQRVIAASEYTLKLSADDSLSITLFKDGRAIVDGTTDVDLALRVYEEVTGIRF